MTDNNPLSSVITSPNLTPPVKIGSIDDHIGFSDLFPTTQEHDSQTKAVITACDSIHILNIHRAQ